MLGVPNAEHGHPTLTDLDCIVGFILGLGPRIFPMLLRFCKGRDKTKPFRPAGLQLGSFPVPDTEKTPLLSSYGGEPFAGLSRARLIYRTPQP